MPFVFGTVGLSQWWVIKDEKIVTFLWGDKYKALSFMLGGGIGMRYPLKKGDVEFQVNGRFLFSQNQKRFGMKDANEGSIGLSLGYVVKL